MKVKAKQLTSVVAYIALVALIVGATFVLVLIGKGYVFDWRNGKITEGGLVLVKSEPAEANVFIDNKSKGNSPKRIPLPAGRFQLKLVKAGYRDWHKLISVEPSAVSWQQYPFLVPDNLSVNNVLSLDNPSVFSQSPNQKAIAIAQNSSSSNLEILEVNKSKSRGVFSLAPELYAGGTRISSATWARDNEHIMIRAEGGGRLLYYVTSISNPAEVFDLSKEFNLPIDNLSFSYDNWQELYWQSPEGLRRIELTKKAISTVLADNLNSHLAIPGSVVMIRNVGAEKQLQRLNSDGSVNVLLKKLPLDDFGLGYVDYGGKQKIVLHNKSTRRIGIYESDDQPNAEYRIYKSIDVVDFTVSKDNRYLLLHGALNFATLDFEFSKTYRFSLGSQPVSNITWFGRHHLLGKVGKSVMLFEYDGGNPEILVDSQLGFSAFSADSQKMIYFVGASPVTNQSTLQLVQMRQ